MVSMVSESPAKALKHSIKCAGDLEKVGIRIVVIAGVKTCKH